jgi:hypothetical protein
MNQNLLGHDKLFNTESLSKGYSVGKQQEKSENKENSDDMSMGNDSEENENNEQYRTGRWHPTEHLRFIKGCLMHSNNWKKVNY